MRRAARVAGAVGVLATVAVVAVGLAGLAGPAGGQDADGDGERADGDTPTTATAVVERRDLVEREELDGTLGYGEAAQLSLGAGVGAPTQNSGQGTITALAAEGSLVERGGTLGEVDGGPVSLLYGARPMWRSMGEGSTEDGSETTEGADVAQLEENLIAMGYGTAASLGPNTTWSQATTAGLKRWQKDLGVEETGRLDLGSVVFGSGPTRIGSHLVEPGASAGAPALSVTGSERLVEVDLAANRQGVVEVGQAVQVELPDGTVVPATVRSVSSVVTPGDPTMGTSATVEVVVVLDDPASAGGLDEAPVDVQVVSVQAEDALAVPVEALLALTEGGYALELPDGSLVGVETGAFADGYVQVTPTAGSLAEGDEIVVPS